MAEHYQNNKQDYINRALKSNPKSIENNRRSVFEFLQGKSCVDCGENDWMVLEFDHKHENEKRKTISQMMLTAYSWNTIKKEIDKCEIRCANCHRRRTMVQFGWKKLKYENVLQNRSIGVVCGLLCLQSG